MNDIRAFLAACLTEDKHAALATRQASHRWQNMDADGELRDSVNAGTVAFVPHDADRAHIARHDPARVLRDVAAKQRVLERHRPATDDDLGWWEGSCVGCGREGRFADARTRSVNDCPELRDAAAPYADRPGYNSTWRAT